MPQTKAEYKSCLPAPPQKNEHQKTHFKGKISKENVQVLGLFLAISLYTSEQSNPLGSPVKSWRNQLSGLLREESKIKMFSGSDFDFQSSTAFSAAVMQTDILRVTHEALPSFRGGRNTSRNQTLATGF